MVAGSRSTYLTWLTNHLHHPGLYKCFSDGCFAFQKSNMGIDQAHEQDNAVIKGIGGATLVLNKDDESGLAWWKLCLHELSLIINEYESTHEVELDFEPLKHHEDSGLFKISSQLMFRLKK